MKSTIIFIGCLLLNVIQCYDSGSSEVNRIEMNPVYDTIIFSDIADIINEFENNVRSPFDAFISSDSGSDEKIEDLLSEYHHYLDKAHKQRINYIEKKKMKNKVPLLRHERYSKTKPASGGKYDVSSNDDGYYKPNTFKFPRTYNNPLDLLIPINPKESLFTKLDLTTSSPKENYKLNTFDKSMLSESIPPIVPYPTIHKEIKSSCYCKNGQIPCDCNCKQCLIPLDTISRNYMEQKSLQYPVEENYQNLFLHDSSFKNIDYHTEDKFKEKSDDTFKMRIKVDIQLPKLLQDDIRKYYRTQNHDKLFDIEDGNSKEFSTAINLPLSYLNFPVSMDMFGYKRASKFGKLDSSPFHKITIHKKKKSKVNSNKKHRKKVFTLHNIKLEPQQTYKANFGDYNISGSKKTEARIISTKLHSIETQTTENNHNIKINETQTERSIILMVNISNNLDNGTEDLHKIENSIETEFTTMHTNVTTEISVPRIKRDISSSNKSAEIKNKDKVLKNIPKNISAIVKDKKNPKKSEKIPVPDTELLYWPYINNNQTQINTNNITSIIVENENKKAKLNMTKETIRYNHTRALEQAIFGDVNWNDVGTVAPAFMSFVGKYMTGVLTFCSESICHSMKCYKKICLHRTCAPIDRLNNKGHCIGSDITDSVASMESIMDLPSKIAFEIVDILEDKMSGKLFGKVTLCIGTKCISFVTSKNFFVKIKCLTKELNSIGHCANAKNLLEM